MMKKTMHVERAQEILARLRRRTGDYQSSDLALARKYQESLAASAGAMAVTSLIALYQTGTHLWFGLILCCTFLILSAVAVFHSAQLARIRQLFEDQAPQNFSELSKILKRQQSA